MFTSNLFFLYIFAKIAHAKTVAGIPGPSEVSFIDENGTLVRVDFSDIEFYPVEDFPLLTASKVNTSDLSPLSDERERNIVNTMIDELKIDSVTEGKPGRVLSAYYIRELREKYPRIDLKAYGIHNDGVEVLMYKKFNKFSVEANFGSLPEDTIRFAVVRIQHRHKFGRKVIRFAFSQSLNNGNPRNIWLTDDIMWRGVVLKMIGRVHTPNGWALMWTD